MGASEAPRTWAEWPRTSCSGNLKPLTPLPLLFTFRLVLQSFSEMESSPRGPAVPQLSALQDLQTHTTASCDVLWAIALHLLYWSRKGLTQQRDYKGTATTMKNAMKEKKQRAARFHSKLAEPGKPTRHAWTLDAGVGVVVAPRAAPVHGATPRALLPRAAPSQGQSKDNDENEEQHTPSPMDMLHCQDENACC